MTVKIVGLEDYKGYKLVRGFATMVVIKALGKGTVTKNLLGSYSSIVMAREAIDRHLEEKVKVETIKNEPNKTTKRV